MRLTYTVAVVALLGCGGGDFRSEETPGPDGGPGVGAGGSGCEGCAGAPASSSAEASSTGEGPGGGGGCGACGGTGDGGAAQSSGSVGGGGGGGGGPCVPQTCAQQGLDCGPVDDGCGTTLDCGSCPVNETCGGDGTPHVCGGCVPKTCAGEKVYCGTMEDGCGNTLDCMGNYEIISNCVYPSPYNCECPFDHGKAWHCDNLPNNDIGNTPPPPGKGDCIVNPALNQGFMWCCETT